jgi:CRISPR/Cas system-associated exonuclease Cas4 (RecB family)
MSPVLNISQAHLRVWDTCHRQFQYAYFDHLVAPLPLSESNALDLGSQFHLILQQKSLGLDVQPLIQDRPQLKRWLTAYQRFEASLPQGEYLTEHRRTLAWNLLDLQEDLQLTVVYDLLILQPDRALIFDWKTHKKPLPELTLAQSWQTRLYLYVLAETSNYQPGQLGITYWFANSETQVQINYDRKLHEQTRQDLQQRLEDLSQCQDSQKLSKLSAGNSICDRCRFYYLCWQGEQNSIDYPEVEI